jgi:hypothetical protein
LLLSVTSRITWLTSTTHQQLVRKKTQKISKLCW